MSRKWKEPEVDAYDPWDYHRLWWSKTIAYQWNTLRGGALLHDTQLDLILANMARMSDALAEYGGETTSFKAREPFWRDLIRQGASASRDEKILDLRGIYPQVRQPIGKDWAILEVMIFSMNECVK